MDFFSLNLKDKVLFSLIVILTLFLAYSESFKNLSAYLLIGFFLWSVITSKIKITKDLVNISIISHLLIVLCGVVFGINTNESLDQSKDVIRIIILFLFFREANLHFLTYERILNLLFLGFVLTALASIYYFIYNFTPTIYNRIELNSVGSINRSAVYITYIFVASICLRNYYQNKSSRIIFLVTIIVSLILIILGASRMAIFSLPIILIMYLVFSKKLNFKYITILGIFFAATALLLFSFFPDSLIVTKVSLGFNDTIRIQIWLSSIYAWIENNWLFGIGVGNSIFINVADYFSEEALSQNIDNPHNLFLDMLLERGLLGLITFLTFISSVFLYKSNNHSFVIFIRTLIFALILMGLANITFRYEFAILFMILVGSYLNSSIKK